MRNINTLSATTKARIFNTELKLHSELSDQDKVKVCAAMYVQALRNNVCFVKIGTSALDIGRNVYAWVEVDENDTAETVLYSNWYAFACTPENCELFKALTGVRVDTSSIKAI